jgi:hypothetical protein
MESKKPCLPLHFRLAAAPEIGNSSAAMKRYLPACLIVGLLVAFRIVGSAFPETLPNFQPLAALFFCGALMAPGWRGFAIPMAIWAVTFPLGVGHSGNLLDLATTLTAITATYFLGKSLSSRGFATLLLGAATAALVFHLITCGSAWMLDPRYPKTLAGLWQSTWAGAPGDTLPSWIFLRNLTAANVLFTGIFLVSRVRLPKASESVPAPAYAKSH